MEFKFLFGPEITVAEQALPVEQRVQWPLDSIVAYCFDGEKIIGRMGIMSIKLIEGTWVAPDAAPTTAFRMMKQMEAVLQHLGNTHAMALVYDEQPKVAEYLTRVGFERFPVTVFSKMLEEES